MGAVVAAVVASPGAESSGVESEVSVGAGDSDYTWQAMAGIGYSFGWGDILGSWRYLDYHMKSGRPVESLNFSGSIHSV